MDQLKQAASLPDVRGASPARLRTSEPPRRTSSTDFSPRDAFTRFPSTPGEARLRVETDAPPSG